MEIKDLLKLNILIELNHLILNISEKSIDSLFKEIDINKLDADYINLLDIFLNEYALNKTEKSE